MNPLPKIASTAIKSVNFQKCQICSSENHDAKTCPRFSNTNKITCQICLKNNHPDINCFKNFKNNSQNNYQRDDFSREQNCYRNPQPRYSSLAHKDSFRDN